MAGCAGLCHHLAAESSMAGTEPFSFSRTTAQHPYDQPRRRPLSDCLHRESGVCDAPVVVSAVGWRTALAVLRALGPALSSVGPDLPGRVVGIYFPKGQVLLRCALLSTVVLRRRH